MQVREVTYREGPNFVLRMVADVVEHHSFKLVAALIVIVKVVRSVARSRLRRASDAEKASAYGVCSYTHMVTNIYAVLSGGCCCCAFG